MAPSILIIDFEQNDLVRMTNALAQAGYVVRTALQSADGLDLFREFAPDLVFVNVLMPGTNGPQVCDRIKDRSRDTAVYFVSSIATGSLGPMLRKSRSDGALKKPLDPAKLVEIAEKHIGPGDPELVRQHREREAAARAPRAKPRSSGPRAAAGDESPAREGRIEGAPFYTIFAELARNGVTGRLEIEIDGDTTVVRWRDGAVVGVQSGGFLPWLVNGKFVSDDEAVAVRRKRRQGLGAMEAILAASAIPEPVLNDLADKWRLQTLTDLAAATHGTWRLYDGGVPQAARMDCAWALFGAVLARHSMDELQKLVEGDKTVAGGFRLSEAMIGQAAPASREMFARIVDRVREGTTLAELFLAGIDAAPVLAGVYTLSLLGRLAPTQTSHKAAGAISDEAPAEKTPSSFFEPPTDFPFDDEFDTTFEADVKPTRLASAASDTAAAPAPERAPAPPPRREPPAAEPAPARIHAPAETPKEKPAPAKAPAATALAPESEIVFDPIDEVIHKGDQLMKASEYGVAHQRFREAVLRDPKRADAHVKLARALYRDRFIDGFERTLEAVAHCKKAIALDGTYVPAYTTMLKILEEENMPAAALDVARRAVENNPGSEDMRARLRAAERRARGE